MIWGRVGDSNYRYHIYKDTLCTPLERHSRAEKNLAMTKSFAVAIIKNVTGPAKTGHICTKYTCSENHTYCDHCLW